MESGPVETKAQRTRRKLLDAAQRLVDQSGASRLTLAAVAREAGVSKGGLLYHFGTKDELIAAMLDRRFTRFDEKRRAKLDDDPDARKKGGTHRVLPINLCKLSGHDYLIAQSMHDGRVRHYRLDRIISVWQPSERHRIAST